MLWPPSIVSLLVLLNWTWADAYPYFAAVPGQVQVASNQDGDGTSGDGTGGTRMFASHQALARGCGGLLRVHNKLHSESGAYALLAEGQQIDSRVLDICAKYLLFPTRITLSDSTNGSNLNWATKKAASVNRHYGPNINTRSRQQRGYDFIRFGKRYMVANKKMQGPLLKSANKNSGTHEYIRFGKK